MKLISVIGTGENDSELTSVAEEVGKEIALRGHAVVCGGLSGIMESVCRGAKSEGGLTIGILPGETKDNSNKYLDIPIITGIGQARNLAVALSGDIIIAIGGGFGTLSEISFALRSNKNIIGINTWDISQEIQSVSTAVEALELASGYLE
ncbi:MAG: TIGR00725 family protein [Thermodesulfobacteriota bacterium]